MNNLRSEARRLAKVPTGDPEVDILLAKLAELTGQREWLLRASWNYLPDYVKPGKKIELQEAVLELLHAD